MAARKPALPPPRTRTRWIIVNTYTLNRKGPSPTLPSEGVLHKKSLRRLQSASTPLSPPARQGGPGDVAVDRADVAQGIDVRRARVAPELVGAGVPGGEVRLVHV